MSHLLRGDVLVLGGILGKRGLCCKLVGEGAGFICALQSAVSGRVASLLSPSRRVILVSWEVPKTAPGRRSPPQRTAGGGVWA